MSTTKYENADAVLAKAGITQQSLACTGKALVLAVVSGKTLAPTILPDEFQLMHSDEDAESAVKRVTTDPSFVTTVLFALSSFVKAKFEGTDFYKDAVTGFYKDLLVASAADQRTALINVLRTIDELLYAEATRCINADGLDVERADQKDVFQAFLDASANLPDVMLTEMFDKQIAFTVNMANMFVWNPQDTIEQARDRNRKEGLMNSFALKMLVDNIATECLKAHLQTVLTPEAFDTFIAAVEAEGADQPVTLH